jgi:hypothetical protein
MKARTFTHTFPDGVTISVPTALLPDLRQALASYENPRSEGDLS